MFAHFEVQYFLFLLTAKQCQLKLFLLRYTPLLEYLVVRTDQQIISHLKRLFVISVYNAVMWDC